MCTIGTEQEFGIFDRLRQENKVGSGNSSTVREARRKARQRAINQRKREIAAAKAKEDVEVGISSSVYFVPNSRNLLRVRYRSSCTVVEGGWYTALSRQWDIYRMVYTVWYIPYNYHKVLTRR